MRRSILLALVLMAAVSLVACGSDSDHSPGGMNNNMSNGMHGSGGTEENQPVVPGAREIRIEAGDLSFQPKRLNLAAGEEVTIVLTSTDIEHDLMVQGIGHIVHADAGETAKGGLKIDSPGTYRFWCTIVGHRAAGMVGTITVT